MNVSGCDILFRVRDYLLAIILSRTTFIIGHRGSYSTTAHIMLQQLNSYNDVRKNL